MNINILVYFCLCSLKIINLVFKCSNVFALYNKTIQNEIIINNKKSNLINFINK